MPTTKTSSQFCGFSCNVDMCATNTFQHMLSYPGVVDEGIRPVTQEIDEQLDDEDKTKGHIEFVSQFSQRRGSSVAEGHFTAELGLEDTDEEILHHEVRIGNGGRTVMKPTTIISIAEPD